VVLDRLGTLRFRSSWLERYGSEVDEVAGRPCCGEMEESGSDSKSDSVRSLSRLMPKEACRELGRV